MYETNKILALIPARGGSKGLPGKVIKLLKNKPLIAWTIEEAKKSDYIDRIIVSTEDLKIADISKSYGAEIPFIRPAELATDEASGIDVVLHAIKWFKGKKEDFDVLILLQPTSPLRIVDDINNSLEMLLQDDMKKSVVSVSEADHHPWWCGTLPKDRCMKNFVREEVKDKNRQELPIFYRLNGAVYCSYFSDIENNKGFFGDSTYAYIMPIERSIDVDTIIDFKLAELLI